MAEQEDTAVGRRWRVIHPSPFTAPAIAGVVLFGGLAGLGLVAGVEQLDKYGDVRPLLFLLGVGAAGLCFLYVSFFAYYVAFDDRHVAHGAPAGLHGRSSRARRSTT